jgi:beta-glucosidase-like glycosyl hydrolase
VPGEDPYLTGEVGSYLLKATQEGGTDPRYLSIAGTMKHSPMYDMEGYNDGGCHTKDGACGSVSEPRAADDFECDTFASGGCNRRNFDQSPPMRDFAGYYTVAFKQIAQRARPAAVMCAYPATYGIPACAHPFHNEVLRGEWGWDGFIVSDCSAIDLMGQHDYFNYSGHNYTKNSSDTVRAGLVQGGTDADCPAGPNFYSLHMMDALVSGAIDKADIDRAARRIFKTMFRLGMMDPMEDQPYAGLGYGAAEVDNAKSREVALASATGSMVLLKNAGRFLPLTREKTKGKFAFIGPHANSTQHLMGSPGYHGTNTIVNSNSALTVARRDKSWAVTYAKGCNICDVTPPHYPNQPCQNNAKQANRSGLAQAVAAAKAADTVVLFLGADQTTEAAGFDRHALALPGAQPDLLRVVLAAAEVTEVVLVLVNGGPLDVSFAYESEKVVAILETFQPGELGGVAMLDLLDGTAAPSGKISHRP